MFPMESPPAALKCTRTSVPVFPCWLWSDLCLAWKYYKTEQGYTGWFGWHTHWYPDQPEVPQCTPAQEESWYP